MLKSLALALAGWLIAAPSATGFSLELGSIALVPERESGPSHAAGFQWTQRPNGANAYVAQEDGCGSATAQVASPFRGDGREIAGVGWWGVSRDDGPAPMLFRVEIYSDSHPSGPGEPLIVVETANAVMTPGTPSRYELTLPEPFRAADGARYWIAVSAITCSPADWGWATGAGSGGDVRVRCPALGIDSWRPGSEFFGAASEMAFSLWSGSVPRVGDGGWVEVSERD